ncbi:MAG: hypothetical protein ACLS3M_08895, partial [Collinsella sp.]
AFGTTPAQLWAEGAEGIAEAVAQAATGGEGAAADDATGTDTGANSAAASAAADGADADQGATASAANGDDTAVDNATESENSAATSAASEQKPCAAASATTLSSEAKVFIRTPRIRTAPIPRSRARSARAIRSGQICTMRSRTTGTALRLSRCQSRHLDLHLARRHDQGQQQCRRLHRGRRPRAVAHRHRRDGRQILHLQVTVDAGLLRPSVSYGSVSMPTTSPVPCWVPGRWSLTASS